MKTIVAFAVVTLALSPWSISIMADTFGVGAYSFQIEFVSIGDPGNVADNLSHPYPVGSVDYVYGIGKYEISREIVSKATAAGDLGLTFYTHNDPRPELPADGVSWVEAARFVNWLNASQGYPPAYKFSIQPGDADYNPNMQLSSEVFLTSAASSGRRCDR